MNKALNKDELKAALQEEVDNWNRNALVNHLNLKEITALEEEYSKVELDRYYANMSDQNRIAVLCKRDEFNRMMLANQHSMLRQQQAEIEALKKEMWMTEVNIQQQTLAHIIKLLTIQHDTLACSSYPMSKKNREAIKK